MAETIAKTITEHGHEVDVISAREARDVSRESAVVVGSAIRGGKIHDDVLHFLEDHEAELSKVPVAYFVCCITMHDDSPDSRYMLRVTLPKCSTKFPK